MRKLPMAIAAAIAALMLAHACGGGEAGVPAAGKMAFSLCPSGSEGPCDLYVINPDGSGLAKVAQGSLPSWSPDGRRVAFVSGTGTSRDIFAISADGSDQTNLTDNPFDDYNPSWSPDGKRIAFVSSRDAPWILTPVPGREGVPYPSGDYGVQQIYVMNADGSDQTRLTENKSGAEGDIAPDWSPDGSRIAFISTRGGSRQVYVMNADGSNQTGLTSVAEGSSLYDAHWSPDGTRIAFNSSGVSVMSADGSAVTRLATGLDAVWSPDGRRLAFHSSRSCYIDGGGPSEIAAVNADGTGLSQLTEASCEQMVADSSPTWSPDGQYIAFARSSAIYVMRADGSNQRALHRPEGAISGLAWSPVP